MDHLHNIADKTYLNLLREVLENGTERSDRTGTGTIGIFGAQMKFDVSERIPLLTTKKININNIIHETLWMFVHGSTNIKYLQDNGVNIWNEWCQEDFSYPPRSRLKGWVKIKPTKEFEEYTGDFSTVGLNAVKNSLEDSLRNLWVKMMKRCYDESSHNYKFYGAKGVFVDKSWHDVRTFVKDAQNLPNWKSKKTSWNLYELDKDYYGSSYYSKETCTWLHTAENNLYIDKPLQIIDDSGSSFVYLSYQEASDSLNIPKTNLYRWVTEGLSEKCNLEYRKYLNYSFSNIEKEGFVYRYLFTNGYLGPIYGTQARRYQSWKYETMVDEENGTGYAVPVFEEIDQIKNVINSLKTDPYSRRHVMTLWNPSTVPSSSLTFSENIAEGNSALPVCFPKGNTICTSKGYKDISEVTVGELVLTNDGSYQPIFNKSIVEKKNLLKIKPFSVPSIYSTPEHPFYTLTGWKKAEELCTEDFVKIQECVTQEIIPTFTFKKKLNKKSFKEVTVVLDDPSFLFFLGYYLGNGFLSGKANPTRFEVSVPATKIEKLAPLFEKHSHFNWKQGSTSNVFTGESSNVILVQLLAMFGHKASNKTIPDFILNLPKDLLESFLKGYLESDGYVRDGNVSRITTVSKNIAYRYQQAMLKLGKVTTIRFQKRPETCIIEGRTVNQKDTYSLEHCEDTPKSFYKWVEGSLYVKVREVTNETPVDYNGLVYNISVANNHTYTINNVLVHNCHGAVIQFYVEKDQDLSVQVYIRSNDLLLGNPYNLINYTLLLYMIAQVTGYKPKNLVVSIGDAHIYKNHIDQVIEQLSRPIDRESPILRLNSNVTNFDDFKFEDFTLEGYDPHPFIKAPISV